MGKYLYLDNMMLQECEAIVEDIIDELYIVLNQTIFYPKSGGVDEDLGFFIKQSDRTEYKIIHTIKRNNTILHQIEEPGLVKGDNIKCKLNWDRRFELMRYHTAAHVLSGVFFNEGKVKVTGNDLVLGQGRIDFNFPDFERSIIERYVSLANDIIDQDLPVETYYITREELEKDPNLTKLNMGLPQSIKKVRIVEIKGFDKQPDGGCHISHLNQIGKIEITNIKNKGKNNRRLYFILH